MITVACFAIVAVVAALAGGISWAVPVVLVAVVAAAYALANRGLQRRELSEHGGDEDAALRDAGDGGLPKAHLIGDDRTALGDTPEVHAEISPHDFPKGAPERQAAERMAEEEDGRHDTTRRGVRPIRANARAACREPSRHRDR